VGGGAAQLLGLGDDDSDTDRDREPVWTAPADDAARAAEWNAYIAGVHAPTERSFYRAFRRLLRDQSHRYAARVERILGGSVQEAVGAKGLRLVTLASVGEDDITAILDDVAERAALGQVSEAEVSAAVKRAYKRTAKQIGAKGLPVFDPAVADPATRKLIASLITNVGDVTKSTVREIIEAGVAEGRTIGELQEVLLGHPDFGAARALRIARTETTRSVTSGSRHAYRAAADLGIAIKRQWLSARDEATRLDHLALDGQEVAVDGEYVVPAGAGMLFAGAHGGGPGDFAEAGMVVNCRCTEVPITTKKED